MLTISEENYKTHKFEIYYNANIIIFEKCSVCSLIVAHFECEKHVDEDISCNDYLIKNIIK